jgi:hypothetical protein
MGFLTWSMPACLLSLALVAPGALADTLAGDAPLKAQALSSSVSPVSSSLLSTRRLEQLSIQIAQQVVGNDSPNLLDSLNLSGLAAIIDNRGNVKLPLGLRVYTALGDASIGFGTNF